MARSADAAEHEDGLALFVSPQTRSRFRETLADERRRGKTLDRLDHFSDLHRMYPTPVPTNQQSADALGAKIRVKGAPTECHVVSSDRTLDGRTLSLDAALAVVEGSEFGTFVSCLPGKLAYFHGETRDERYLLQRSN
jgi:hypothetical protein